MILRVNRLFNGDRYTCLTAEVDADKDKGLMRRLYLYDSDRGAVGPVDGVVTVDVVDEVGQTQYFDACLPYDDDSLDKLRVVLNLTDMTPLSDEAVKTRINVRESKRATRRAIENNYMSVFSKN
jgi:hypothetical protein